MLKKYTYLLIVAVIAVLVLSGCERSASNVSLPTPTADTGFDTGLDQADDPMAMLQSYATMTALAQNSQPATETPPPPTTGTETTVLPSLTPSPTPTVALSPTPAVAIPTAIITRPATYTLLQGESLFCIARRYNVNQYEVLSINNMTMQQAGNLLAGQVLTIPQTGNPFSGDRSLHDHPATYIVQLNDTLYRVACYFGDVDPSTIITANALVAPYTLQVGQQLNIP